MSSFYKCQEKKTANHFKYTQFSAIIPAMDSTQKFYSDIQKAIKHERAAGAAYNPRTAGQKAAELLSSYCRGLDSLTASIGEYWLKTCIDASSAPDAEPTEESIRRLTAFYAFLQGTVEDTQELTEQDWKELGTIVSCEAEDLPLELLNTLMTMIVDKQALN